MNTERRKAFVAMGWGFVIGGILAAPLAYWHASLKARKPSFVLPLTALLVVAPGGSTGALVGLLVSGRRKAAVKTQQSEIDHGHGLN